MYIKRHYERKRVRGRERGRKGEAMERIFALQIMSRKLAAEVYNHI